MAEVVLAVEDDADLGSALQEPFQGHDDAALARAGPGLVFSLVLPTRDGDG